MNIRYMLDDGAFAPKKAHEEDAGFDLRTPVDFTIHKGSETFIDTGIHVEIPKGYVGLIKSKSGLNKRYSIRAEGVIDAGYTGTIGVKMYMDNSNRFQLKQFARGDKITQLVILPIPEVRMIEAKELDKSERGADGFGSTGR